LFILFKQSNVVFGDEKSKKEKGNKEKNNNKLFITHVLILNLVR